MLKLPRRNFLRLGAAATALPAVSRLALGARLPDAARASARRLLCRRADRHTGAPAPSQSLSQRAGQQFAVEDAPGAGTNVATEKVIRSDPDGYTLLMATSSNAINASLYTGLHFDFIRYIVRRSRQHRPHADGDDGQSVACGEDGRRIHRLRQGQSRQHQHGVTRQGRSVHLAGELFMTMTGVRMTIVHYRESYVPDMLAGRMQVVFSPYPDNDRANQGREAARPSSDQQHTVPGTSGHSASRGRPTRLRRRRMEWHGGAEGHVR